MHIGGFALYKHLKTRAGSIVPTKLLTALTNMQKINL